MSGKEIPDSTIKAVAEHINSRSQKNYGIPVVGNVGNIETPQVFEILPFDQIDKSTSNFYAIDGSINSKQFYNGLSIGIYAAGYICFNNGKQVRLNSLDDPIVLGQAYYPKNILVTSDEHLFAIYDELLSLPPVQKLLSFFDDRLEHIFGYDRETTCRNLPTLLGFSQQVLELALVYEIAKLPRTQSGDFILTDGTLRPLSIRQKQLIKLGRYLHERNITIVAVTKQSPVKMELAYTFKQIDNYLQNDLINKYPFVAKEPKRQKLCCWFEVSDPILEASYQGDMFIRKSIQGGRGFGLFFAARLDYVEKLQNYDWIIVDLNLFDAVPTIDAGGSQRDVKKLNDIFKELTRLTQEHYILGYPYPLAEVHNFISLQRSFNDEILGRLKYSLYKDQRMDNVDIENLFLDMHDRF